MEIYFKYKNKIISTTNLEKKLKRLKINIDDIEIIDPIETKSKEVEEKIINSFYYFFNQKTKETITSIYDNLDDLKEIINIKDWNICQKQ